MMNANPNTAPIRPSAPPRFSGGKVSPITALATGKMPPAPRPCTTRPRSSSQNTPEPWENATTSDPAANSATSRTYTARRPKKSLSLAISGVPIKFART